MIQVCMDGFFIIKLKPKTSLLTVVVVVGPSVTVVVVARNSRHVAQQIASPVSVPHALVLARALQLTVFSTSTQTSVVPKNESGLKLSKQ